MVPLVTGTYPLVTQVYAVGDRQIELFTVLPLVSFADAAAVRRKFRAAVHPLKPVIKRHQPYDHLTVRCSTKAEARRCKEKLGDLWLLYTQTERQVQRLSR